MGVSRGSFYWHFADIGAFHAAILKHWREVAAEQIIAGLEAAAKNENPLSLLLNGAFASRQTLEKAVRSWATADPKARAAVQAIDRRRIDYVEHMLRQAGVKATVASAPRKSCIGRFWATPCRTSRCRRPDRKPSSTNCCGWQRGPDMLEHGRRAGEPCG